ASEKIYSDYQLAVTDSGGHSSLPKPKNPIYELSNALVRLQDFNFPVEFNEVTRVYYDRLSKTESGQRSADMKAILKNPPDHAAVARLSHDVIYYAMLHTSCVSTSVIVV